MTRQTVSAAAHRFFITAHFIKFTHQHNNLSPNENCICIPRARRPPLPTVLRFNAITFTATLCSLQFFLLNFYFHFARFSQNIDIHFVSFGRRMYGFSRLLLILLLFLFPSTIFLLFSPRLVRCEHPSHHSPHFTQGYFFMWPTMRAYFMLQTERKINRTYRWQKARQARGMINNGRNNTSTPMNDNNNINKERKKEGKCESTFYSPNP